MKNVIAFCLFLSFLGFIKLSAQSMAVNDDGTVAHPSAMLDVKVTAAAKKGVLIPRMTTSQRTAIASPAKGLLVFDNDNSSFWFHNGTSWQQLSQGSNKWTASGSGIYNNNSGSVGIGLSAPKGKLHVAEGGTVIFGRDSVGVGAKLLWIPSKAAFRAGRVDFAPDGWDYARIGNGSIALGTDVWATGYLSVALGGPWNSASGASSFAAGGITGASGDYAASFGEYSSASGDISFCANFSTVASGHSSAAFGEESHASGEASFSANTSTSAKGISAAAFGKGTDSRGEATFAIGTYNDTIVSTSDATNSRNPLFIVGNGTNLSNRKNAFVVVQSGRVGVLKNPGSVLANDASLQVKSLTGGYDALALEASGSTNKWSFGVTTNMSLYCNNALRGTFNCATGAYTNVSDIRFKKDIVSLAGILPKFLQLKTYSYHLKDNSCDDPLSYGLMAQEVQRIFPEIVTIIDNKNNEQVYGLNYNNFTVLAIKAIQEQQGIIADQKKVIGKLQQQMDEMEKRMQKLEKRSF